MKPALGTSKSSGARSGSGLSEQLTRRPGLLAAVGLAIGIGTAYSLVPLAIGLLVMWWLGKDVPRLLASLAMLAGYVIAPPIPAHGITERMYIEGRATVVSMPSIAAAGETCTIETYRGRFQLLEPGVGTIAYGDTIYVGGVAKPLSEGTESYFLHKGILGTIVAPRDPVIIRSGWHIGHIAALARRSFIDFSSRTLGKNDASILDALCFNVDAGLSDVERDELSRSGTIHIISASGLHVVVVAWVLSMLLRGLPVPRWSQLVLLGILLVIYAGAAGLRPPCVRAVMMSMMFSAAYLFQREPDNLSALGISAIPFLIIAPESIFDIGFQLSFITVGGLILFIQYVESDDRTIVKKIGSLVRMAVQSSIVASVVSAPLIAYHFGFVSLVSIPANLLIGVPVILLVVIGMVGWLFSGLLPGVVGLVMLSIAHPLAAYLRWSFDAFGGREWSALNIPPFSAYWLVPIYGLGLLLWKPYVRTA